MNLNKKSLYIIGCIVLILGLFVTRYVSQQKAEIDSLHAESSIRYERMGSMMNEFQVGQVKECRSYTESIILHKAYIEEYRALRDTCVSDLSDKGIEYDDLKNPVKHYTTTGTLFEGFDVVKRELEPSDNKVTVDITHTAAQPQ